MKHIPCTFLIIVVLLHSLNLDAQTKNKDEIYRPKIHFSPKEKWINDPNGLVYYKGVYHLFFQHHPGSSVWGPMHWGHATSNDLVQWKHEPIALFPDSIGTIFSGSAVVDMNNTSGFGMNGRVPLVAIYTQHDESGEKAGRNNFQNQSLAYSLDNGKSWKKYSGNPVLKNPGIRDFRDPKVMWHGSSKKWIMSLAAADRIIFYSSPDLKKWTKESEFGESAGAHGGVWECPDLFSLQYNGKHVWVLIVNINPGGPNKGSATQYFLGDFDGKRFSPNSTNTKWLDYGPDEYAGITWENTGKRKIFLGWMSNWLYANVVPTETWRNAMTIPRDLKLVKVGNEMFIASEPVKEIAKIKSTPVVVSNISLSKAFDLSTKTGKVKLPCLLNLALENSNDFSITISNDKGEELQIGYDKMNNQYFIDRTRSGKTDFQNEFAARHTAPRFAAGSKMNLVLLIDVSSVELFADDGLTVMTEIFFPNQPYNRIYIQSSNAAFIKSLEYYTLGK
ncbi:MAG: glycoside hydrolase family 32 protein [Chitinophagales bacterium]